MDELVTYLRDMTFVQRGTEKRESQRGRLFLLGITFLGAASMAGGFILGSWWDMLGPWLRIFGWH